jgi:hypothetical protein
MPLRCMHTFDDLCNLVGNDEPDVLFVVEVIHGFMNFGYELHDLLLYTNRISKTISNMMMCVIMKGS